MILNYKRLKIVALLFLVLTSTNLLATDSSNTDQSSFKTPITLGGINLDNLLYTIKRPGYTWQEISSLMFFTKSISQYTFNKKILSYIKSSLSKIPQETKDYIIQNLMLGYCVGYSSLWVYSKWLQIKNPSSNDKYGPVKRMEDKDWMKSNMILIAAWDKKTLDEEEIASIDDFITNLEYFQWPFRFLNAHQGDLNNLLCDTNKGYPNKEYSITALFTLNQLKQLLNTENFTRNGRLILISSDDHMTALFKNGNNYHYFDPNNPEGEITTSSIDYVAEYILYALAGSSWLKDYNTPSLLFFSVFSFDKNNFP